MQPPLRITGALCVLVSCLLAGLIVRNALRGEEMLTLPTPPPAEAGVTKPLPKSTADTPRNQPPTVPDYSREEEGGEGQVGESTPEGLKPLRAVAEGFAILVPTETKAKLTREGPTVTVKLASGEPLKEVLSITSRSLYPWTSIEELRSRYAPYNEGARVKGLGGVDFDGGGHEWSFPDDKTIVIVRSERLYVIRGAGFGEGFPELVELVNGFQILKLETHTERLAAQHSLSTDQLAGPPPEKLAAEIADQVEKLQGVRGGMPGPVRYAMEFYNAGEVSYRDTLLLKELFTNVLDYIAKSMSKH